MKMAGETTEETREQNNCIQQIAAEHFEENYTGSGRRGNLVVVYAGL